MKKFILFVLIIQFSSIIANAQWVQMSNAPYGATIQCLAKSGTNVFAGTNLAGVFLTTNNGENWLARGFTGQTVYSLLSNGAYLLAGTLGGISRSTNNGLNWVSVYNSSDINFISLAYMNFNIFAGTDGAGILRSTNNGSNWTAVNNGLTNKYVHSLLTSGTNVFAATNGGVFLSTNNGGSWSVFNNSLTNLSVNILASSGINLFAGTWGGGVFISSINGGSWTAVNNGLTNLYIRALDVSGSNTFISNSGGIFLSTVPGSVWINRNQGFITTPIVNSFLIANNYIFAGTENQSIWRRDLSEIITGAEVISQNIPGSYSLKQNYPNPFNPVTKIKFDIKKSVVSSQYSVVSLKVFDILGKEIQTLVNEHLQPGTYEVIFDGSNLHSGVYFYKLRAGEFSETKKFVLLK